MKNFLGISIPLIKIAWKVIKVIFAIFSQKKPTTEERWGRYHTIYRMRSGIYANKITHNFFCALFSIYPSLYLSIHISHSLPIFFSTVFFCCSFETPHHFILRNCNCYRCHFHLLILGCEMCLMAFCLHTAQAQTEKEVERTK